MRRITKAQKDRAFEIACDAWRDSGQRFRVARRLTRKRVAEEFGSIIIWITLAAAILDICYTLLKIWQDLSVENPRLNRGWESKAGWNDD